MQVKLDISFNQLLRVVKTLPPKQLRLLKAEINREEKIQKPTTDLETLLLNGPIATQEELNTIKENRKAINQWRKKP
jgi:hypothetical protein